MKIRSDFVSNSSSSSFIIIGRDNYISNELHDRSLELPTYKGNYEFGWQFSKYDDIYSKLNFCFIILNDIYYYKDNDIPEWNSELYKKYVDKFKDYKSLFEEVCKNELHLNIKMKFGTTECYVFIDHQSNIFEQPDNGKMFESYDNMKDFLLSKDSCIVCGNDNTDHYPQWYLDLKENRT